MILILIVNLFIYCIFIQLNGSDRNNYE